MGDTYTNALEKAPWFQRIMDSEGGLNLKEPASVGGKSYGGISQLPYGDWRSRKCQIADAPMDVQELAGSVIGTEWEKRSPLDVPEKYGVRVDCIIAFYKDYFKLARLAILPECLQYMHADFFVNAKFSANKILQRMVGFTEEKDLDGILGPATRERIRAMREKLEGSEDPTADDDMIMDYHDLKIEHYESLKDVNPVLYHTNIKGWRKRAQHILAELGDYFHDEEPTVSAIHDDEEIDLFDDPEEQVQPSDLVEQVTASVIAELPALVTSILNNVSKRSFETKN